jgi:small subunit ribosomal protein S20
LATAAPKKRLSVLKRDRQNEKRNQRNRAVVSKIKTYTKKVDEALKSKDEGQVGQALREAEKVIRSAASKGVLHRNTASRKISRLTRRANAALKAEESA